jgi:branched-subunit amino acid transport protein
MSAALVWGVIGGMALTNILMRGVPIMLLSRLKLPAIMERWFRYIPVCVMSAIVATTVLRPGGAWLSPLHNPYLLAAIPTAVVYRFSRSFLGATVAGMVAFLALRYLLG